jgi:acetyl esterase
MKIDPGAQQVIDLIKAVGRPPYETVGHMEARRLYLEARRVLQPDPPPIGEMRDLTMPGPAGPISIRLYRARPGKAGDKQPALIYFHGGGWVIGNLDSHDGVCRGLANGADCTVLSVDYRLAPEHKFPAAVEDAVAATQWIAENSNQLGIDADRLAVGGDSAGGNLAAVCAILARDEGHPKLAFQLLIYPCTAPEPETPSHRKFAEGHLLTRNTITWFYKQYTRTSKEHYDFRFAPLVAEDLSNLPPALVLVAGYDPLRDEGVDYARRLIEGGNRVSLINYEGMVHGFLLMGGAIDAAKRALAQSAAVLHHAFAQVPAP